MQSDCWVTKLHKTFLVVVVTQRHRGEGRERRVKREKERREREVSRAEETAG